MTTETLLSKVECVKPNHSGWSAKCPAHDGQGETSLSITETVDGKILLKCFAGCKTEAIVESLGLTMTDLFPDKKPSTQAKPKYKTVAEYSYVDVDGTLLYQSLRKECPGYKKKFCQRRPDGNGWVWNMDGVTKVIYNLPSALKAIESGKAIFVCEGEKDCETLAAIGLTATTNVGGAGKWQTSYSESLSGANVAILPDNDVPGREHGELVAKSLQGFAKNLKVVQLPNLPEHGDVTDWLESGHTKEELLALVKAAKPWEPTATIEPETKSQEPETETDSVFSPYYNASRFYKTHGQDVRFCCDDSRWYIWTGEIWRKDETGEIRRMMLDSIRTLYSELANLSRGESESLFRHIKTSESDAGITGALEILKLLDGVTIRADVLDADPWLLAVKNGVVNLKTGKLQPFSKNDLLTVQISTAYDPGAKCARWDRYLEEVFPDDHDTRQYLQRFAGYAITGNANVRTFVILYGKQGTGKSVFVETLTGIMGAHASPILKSALVQNQHGATNDRSAIASLWDKRLVSVSEFTAHERLDIDLVKTLAGGNDTIAVRHLYSRPFSVKPKFKLLFSTNFIPRIQATDGALRDRMRIIPFTQTFYPASEQKFPTRDLSLPAKLATECSGILNWLIAGCLDFQQTIETAGEIPASKAVMDCTNSCFEEQDSLAEFLDAECCFDVKLSTLLKDLWAALENYCQNAGRKLPFADSRGLKQNLQNREGLSFRKNRQKSVVCVGIALQNSESAECAESNGTFPETILHVGHGESLVKMPLTLLHTPHSEESWPDLCGYCGESVEWKPIPGSDQAEYTCPCLWHKVKPISELSDV